MKAPANHRDTKVSEQEDKKFIVRDPPQVPQSIPKHMTKKNASIFFSVAFVSLIERYEETILPVFSPATGKVMSVRPPVFLVGYGYECSRS